MLTTLTNLLYPSACLLCRAPLRDDPDALCQPCRRGLQGHPLPRRHVRADCFAAAPFAYTPLVREAIHAFKYDHRRRVGAWLAEQMVSTARTNFPLSAISTIASVPMHWLKRRLRGYDPVAWLADEVAAGLHLPHQPSLLKRRRWTPSQTRLSPARRLRNVRGAFCLGEDIEAGRAVLLIDDVLTSGATAGECARTLKAAGAGDIFILTAARAQLP